ncbi:SulA-like leucine-rich domain-containing protein [Vibrio sp. LaRot3]|uniref:SulA-like leucine-rich domain-containing protein n=1 Tax=Vibrio sp. LaRot3 TaxID=2998829 RepID=UPI0022CDEFF6|nr:SulA-like leucine-rich domain-containing protein [Vibrio sp. LaRot3]MDA0147472.1 SulA-like leucine-rich domain-containing protein [Vibrio sp. LaRot3]
MIQAHTQSFSKYNVLARPTSPMNIDNDILNRLAGLSLQSQWIFFTAQCPRPDFAQFSASNVSCKKIIQLKDSNIQSELEIVMKAIKSGNASAIVASNAIDPLNQRLLTDLAHQHNCEVFFVEGRVNQYH